MAYIEFKNPETQAAFMAACQPVTHPVKLAYQKYKNGKAVLTVYTRD